MPKQEIYRRFQRDTASDASNEAQEKGSNSQETEVSNNWVIWLEEVVPGKYIIHNRLDTNVVDFSQGLEAAKASVELLRAAGLSEKDASNVVQIVDLTQADQVNGYNVPISRLRDVAGFPVHKMTSVAVVIPGSSQMAQMAIDFAKIFLPRKLMKVFTLEDAMVEARKQLGVKEGG